MSEKGLSEIPRDLREMFQKGNAALQRQNYDYALTFFEQVLRREPGFFECRQALRATQFKKTGGKTSIFKRVLGGASASPLIAKAQVQIRKDPLEAIQIAEQVLNGDPTKLRRTQAPGRRRPACRPAQNRLFVPGNPPEKCTQRFRTEHEIRAEAWPRPAR